MKRHAKEVIDATLKITAGIALPLGLASMITGFAVANSTDYWQANKPDNEATAQAVQTVEDKEVAGDLKVKFQNGDITYMEFKNELEKIKPQAEVHQEIINSVSDGTVKVEYSDENVYQIGRAIGFAGVGLVALSMVTGGISLFVEDESDIVDNM